MRRHKVVPPEKVNPPTGLEQRLFPGQYGVGIGGRPVLLSGAAPHGLILDTGHYLILNPSTWHEIMVKIGLRAQTPWWYRYRGRISIATGTVVAASVPLIVEVLR